MRVVWVTDIHLNFLRPKERAAFYSSIDDAQPEVVFITGDIAEAPCLRELLLEMQLAIAVPIYFVLGNHDFYHGSIEVVRCDIQDWSRVQSGLHYLTGLPSIELTPKTVLLGHDGWGDGRLGSYEQSPVRLSDQELIRDFRGLNREAVLGKLQSLGDAAAQILAETLSKALESYQEVLCLTHVPPFKEACWYQGKTGNDDWLPYFACKAVGDVLREVAQARPHATITVLCGHTHHSGTVEMLPNLRVLTGSAEYGDPCISDVIELS